MKTIEEEFNEGQQELIDKFKVRMKKISEETLSELYTDVISFASTDAHINYHNFLRHEFLKSFEKDLITDGRYSWASDFRKMMLKEHPEELKNKIIEDLQHEIEKLQGWLKERRYP